MCINEINQRKHLKEDKTDAPLTVFLESLLSTLVIDDYEGRDVSTFDVKGAF